MGKYKQEGKKNKSVFFLMRRAGRKAEFPESDECVGTPNSIILTAWSLSRLDYRIDTSEKQGNIFRFRLLNS